jgi:hypothetical protein
MLRREMILLWRCTQQGTKGYDSMLGGKLTGLGGRF